MKNYKQLTLSQRYQIESLLQAGLSQTAIALILQVNKSTISRELSRNVAKRGRTSGIYKAESAQSKTAVRHRDKTKNIILTESLKKRIESLLQYEKWSPELIAKRLSLESEYQVSHETIYKWIWECKHSNHRKHRPYKKLYTHLRHTGRRQKRKNIKDKRGAIIGRIPISERPKVVELRTRIGDIEVDLMMVSNHKSALLVNTDRTTLVTMLEKLQSKNADEIY